MKNLKLYPIFILFMAYSCAQNDVKECSYDIEEYDEYYEKMDRFLTDATIQSVSGLLHCANKSITMSRALLQWHKNIADNNNFTLNTDQNELQKALKDRQILRYEYYAAYRTRENARDELLQSIKQMQRDADELQIEISILQPHHKQCNDDVLAIQSKLDKAQQTRQTWHDIENAWNNEPSLFLKGKFSYSDLYGYGLMSLDKHRDLVKAKQQQQIAALKSGFVDLFTNAPYRTAHDPEIFLNTF